MPGSSNWDHESPGGSCIRIVESPGRFPGGNLHRHHDRRLTTERLPPFPAGADSSRDSQITPTVTVGSVNTPTTESVIAPPLRHQVAMSIVASSSVNAARRSGRSGSRSAGRSRDMGCQKMDGAVRRPPTSAIGAPPGNALSIGGGFWRCRRWVSVTDRVSR